MNILSPAADAVRNAVGVPIHLAETVLDAVADQTKEKTKEESTFTGISPTIYELADPMLDFSTLIYPYSFLRRAFSNQIAEFLVQVNRTPEEVRPLRVALGVMKSRLDVLNESGEGGADYAKSVAEVRSLQERLQLTAGDIEILKKYYAVLAPNKTIAQIKADLTVYADTISTQLFLFGSEEFNVQSARSLVDDDPGAVFVHIDDEFNLKGALGFNTEVVYAIVKSDKQKRITIVFRGSVTGNDWMQNFQSNVSEMKLPGYTTDANLRYQKGYGRVHSGFYDYLFGKTGAGKNGRTIAKSEEIMGRINDLLLENPDYSIFVTGHSLGGALSTLMAFRLAIDTDIQKPVTNVSFASPFAGDQEFRNNFYDLEIQKKIQHLRVSNEDDVVPLIPFSAIHFPPLFFKHTGVNVKLFNKSWIAPAYKISYPKKGSLLNEVRNAITSNVLLGITIKSISNHLCPEYRDRLEKAKNEGLNEKTLDELYSDPDLTGWAFPPETDTPAPRQASFVSEF